MEQDFSNDFDLIVDLVQSCRPFTFLRFADGEYAWMKSIPCHGIDGWQSPSHPTILGEDLTKAIQQKDSRYIIGIPCDCCDASGNGAVKSQMLKMLKVTRRQVTFSNLFVNGNFCRFNDLLKAISGRNVIVVTSAVTKPTTREFGFGNALLLPCPKDCSEWNTNKDQILFTLKQYISRVSGSVVLLAAGPMSEPIAVELTSFNPTNQYIDVGSSIDPLVHGRTTRPYQAQGSDQQRKCKMSSLTHKFKQSYSYLDLLDPTSSVSVLINGYLRPSNVDRIVEACLSQSVLPAEIIIRWNNREAAKQSKYSRYFPCIYSDRNTGVWSRFHDAFDLMGEYICIFDDDTIPGSRWLENCLVVFSAHPGLLGTVGLRFKDISSYMNHSRYGWPAPSETVSQVDIVGHCWFFKREWLYLYWSEQGPRYLKLAGEDIHFSYILQKHGIKTYVPPHPQGDKTLWGSLAGSSAGTDSAAISMHPDAAQKWDVPFHSYLSKGWRLLCQD